MVKPTNGKRVIPEEELCVVSKEQMRVFCAVATTWFDKHLCVLVLFVFLWPFSSCFFLVWPLK